MQRGALMLQVSPDATKDSIDVQIANAIELLQSRWLVERVVERERLGLVLGGDKQDPAVATQTIQQAIRASRRGDSSVIEVGIADQMDPRAAMDVCNRLMQAFFEHRLEARVADIRTRMAALASELEQLERAADPRLGDVKKRLHELELESLQQKSDVQLVDPCRIRDRPRT